jgi:tricarballylate dehydrogenase
MEDVNRDGLIETIKNYNSSINQKIKFDHSKKDGRKTIGLEVNKTNWANTIDTPPFEAYAVTCGITFTFGGLKTVPDTGQVLDVNDIPMSGLYAAGEMVGGIFYFNYPAGTGLVSGTVFGRIAGKSAGSSLT